MSVCRATSRTFQTNPRVALGEIGNVPQRQRCIVDHPGRNHLISRAIRSHTRISMRSRSRAISASSLTRVEAP